MSELPPLSLGKRKRVCIYWIEEGIAESFVCVHGQAGALLKRMHEICGRPVRITAQTERVQYFSVEAKRVFKVTAIGWLP